MFLHAVLAPIRELKPHELLIKEASKNILLRVEAGEQVTTTTSHISEVANILESRTSKAKASLILQSLVDLQNLTILPLTPNQSRTAAAVSGKLGTGYNDALAYLAMQDNGINTIYSFDKDFDKLTDIKRITT